jgi:excisionase family DNA binding protein
MSEVLILSVSKEELKAMIQEAVLALSSVPPASKPEIDTQLLKIEQVCELLKVSKVTIHKWKRLGIIPFHRISNRIFFKKEEVLQALKNIDLKGSKRY